jgi:hypothetical protein
VLSEQLQQKIQQISDTTLYKEAPEFLHWLIQKKDCQPLPNTQINGLLNIAKGASYSELEQFIKHQRDRTWTFSKTYIKTFYTELEIVFTTMRNKRLREEFHLLDSSLSIPQMQQQASEIMAALAYEFIQHLEAENRLEDALRADQRSQNRPQNAQKR